MTHKNSDNIMSLGALTYIAVDTTRPDYKGARRYNGYWTQDPTDTQKLAAGILTQLLKGDPIILGSIRVVGNWLLIVPDGEKAEQRMAYHENGRVFVRDLAMDRSRAVTLTHPSKAGCTIRMNFSDILYPIYLTAFQVGLGFKIVRVPAALRGQVLEELRLLEALKGI
jgi:hypothetical protein